MAGLERKLKKNLRESAYFAVFEDFVEHVGEGSGAGARGVLRVLEAAGE